MHIVHVIARLNDGGPARVVAELALGARETGHRVSVLYGRVAADERDLGPELVARGLEAERVPGLGRAPSPLDDALALGRLRRRLRARAPDLVHTHTAKAGLLGRLAARSLGLPCLHSYHGHVLRRYFAPGMETLLRLVERWVARGSHCHSLTPSLVRELRDGHRVGLPWRWHCLPVPVRPVTPVAAAWQPTGEGALRIGFLGRLAPVKDIALWLHTVARVARGRGVHAVVCGDGSQRAMAETLARRLGLAATFTGTVPAGEALGGIDLLLMSSRNEGLPLSAVEAAGAGIPVVAPRVGGLVDLARDGLVVAARRHPRDLATAVVDLLDPARRAEQVQRGRQVARRYAPERVVPRYLRLYRELAQP